MKEVIDDPRREFLVKCLSMGIFAGTNLAALAQPVHSMGRIPNKLPEGRSIFRVDGNVTVDGRTATLDTPIGPNSRIRTGEDGRIIFVVGSDAFILRSDSEVEIDSSDGVIIESLRILTGRILSVFGKRDKPHQIITSTATIGIRGTGIYVESDPEKSYVCTCYGRVRIVAGADPDVSEDIVSEHHDYPVYVLPEAAGNRLIVPGPFISHTDAELALIEELVGRTTPFAYSGGTYDVPRKRTY